MVANVGDLEDKDAKMYRVELDKVTGCFRGDIIAGAYKSRTVYHTYAEARKAADKEQDRLNAKHIKGDQHFPYWERRIVAVLP